MNKTIITLLCLVFVAGSVAIAGNSGVSDPAKTITKFTTQRNLRNTCEVDISSLNTAVVATIDALDTVQFETGTATHTEVVAFVNTYASAPVVLIQSGNATNVSYASSTTTTNFTANMKAATTNTYIVFPLQ